jgi:hypothetical protein
MSWIRRMIGSNPAAATILIEQRRQMLESDMRVTLHRASSLLGDAAFPRRLVGPIRLVEDAGPDRDPVASPGLRARPERQTDMRNLSKAGRTTDQVSGAFGAEGWSGCRCVNFRHHGRPRNASPNLDARSSPHRERSLERSWPAPQGTGRPDPPPRLAFSASSRAQRVTDSRAACARRAAAEHRTGSFHLLRPAASSRRSATRRQ